jgi:hypothetical protein
MELWVSDDAGERRLVEDRDRLWGATQHRLFDLGAVGLGNFVHQEIGEAVVSYFEDIWRAVHALAMSITKVKIDGNVHLTPSLHRGGCP